LTWSDVISSNVVLDILQYLDDRGNIAERGGGDGEVEMKED
jgi:hypothetical protein